MAPMALSGSKSSTSPPRARGGLAHLAQACAALLVSIATAAPQIPADDSTVLEHVPAVTATRILAPLQARVATHPTDLASALALAQGYIDIGRANSDPRFVSYAEATLTPWLQRQHPDPAVLTLQATALQYLHRFAEALGLLDQALAAAPFNAQAWLTRATILQVQGHFDAARESCRNLIRSSGQLIALACLTSVNSLTGKLSVSYMALRQVFTDDPRLGLGVRVWILDQLGDMAQRLGDDSAAESHFQAALRVSPNDGYTKGEYADLLIRRGRAFEVMHLLQNDEQQDNLLLRLAIAATRLRTTQAGRLSDEFQARYEAARRDGDTTHLREQARFLLEVRGRTSAALSIAARNWTIQREPADARIYWAAAVAADSAPDLRRLRDWIQQTGYEDALLGKGIER
jgi:Tfp pilus assembly protein PilF